MHKSMCILEVLNVNNALQLLEGAILWYDAGCISTLRTFTGASEHGEVFVVGKRYGLHRYRVGAFLFSRKKA